jgi:hypothetical protein
MTVDLNGDQAESIIRSAFAMSSQEGFGNPPTQGDNTVEKKDAPTDVEETTDSAEEDVDNNESEEGDQEDDEEDYEESSEEETEDEEVEPEPEDESYDSGYVYFDEGLNKKVFLRAVDSETGKGSIYLNRKDAERGLARQLEYIKELETKTEETKARYEQDLVRLKKDLQIYELTAKPDQIRAGLIADKMPEKFRSVDPKKLGEAEYDEYRAARIDAEVSVDREIRKLQDDAEKTAKESADAQAKADTHVKNRTNDTTFFGLTNTEDRFVITKRLKEVPDGSQYSYYDMAVSVAKAFGPGVADQFLKAAVQDIVADAPETKTPTKEKTSEAPAKKKAEQVDQIKKKVKVKKPSSNNSGGSVPQPANPRDMINMAFAASKNKPRRQ